MFDKYLLNFYSLVHYTFFFSKIIIHLNPGLLKIQKNYLKLLKLSSSESFFSSIFSKLSGTS